MHTTACLFFIVVTLFFATGFQDAAEPGNSPRHCVVCETTENAQSAVDDEGDGVQGKNRVLRADPAIQQTIHRLVPPLQDAANYYRDLESLGKLPATKLIHQLIVHHAQATDVMEGMTLTLVLHQLRFSKATMATAIAPLIGTTGDEKLERGMIDVADLVEDRDSVREPDFSHYSQYIATGLSKDAAFNEQLIAHMFRRAPGVALETIALAVYSGDERKPFLWARHVVSDTIWKRQHGFVPPREPSPDAAEQIERMAQRDEWWRDYTPRGILSQLPELGTPELIERLRADKHELVREPLAPGTKVRKLPLTQLK